MQTVTASALPLGSADDVVRAYHERTKHRLDRYAAGPELLDWDTQPAPFRSYGCAELVLPLLSELASDTREVVALAAPFRLPLTSPPTSVAPTLSLLSVLLQTSLGITSWKTYGPDRWAVRANPSSGNLHPTEAYVLAQGIDFLEDGIYHYLPDRHALERRARGRIADPPGTGLFVALTSAMWRESWKYGERGFRYCQLDIGHAVGALAVAAAALGLCIREVPSIDTELLGRMLGVAPRDARVPESEREEAEVLLRLECTGAVRLALGARDLRFDGSPSTLDPRPLYAWPIVEQVARATRRGADRPQSALCEGQRWAALPSDAGEAAPPAIAEVVLGRRSAQRFDVRHVMPLADFCAVLRALLPCDGAPWTALAGAPRIDLVLFVHRVESLTSGLYLLQRRGSDSAALRARLERQFAPRALAALSIALPLEELCPVEPRALARLTRTLHCHQDIAATSCFALAMIAEFDGPLSQHPAAYRDLHREAGVVGQALYLAAEAHGLRGTGVGCYFDDAVHELLGLTELHHQSLYHFTVGKALDDPRCRAEPGYAPRDRRCAGDAGSGVPDVEPDAQRLGTAQGAENAAPEKF